MLTTQFLVPLVRLAFWDVEEVTENREARWARRERPRFSVGHGGVDGGDENKEAYDERLIRMHD